MKILVTGPNGTIAKNLIDRLSSKYKIYTISSKTIDNNQKILKNYVYKNDYHQLEKFLKKINPKIVIHLSTRWKKFDDFNNKDLIDSNIIFSSYLLDICTSLKLKIFINTSSYTQINSKGIFKPFNFYSASKEAFTNILYYFYLKKNFKIINLRIMNVYGTFSDNRIVNFIFDHIKKKKKIIFINDSKAFVDLIHINDVVSGIISILNCKNLGVYKNFSYDLSSKKQISIFKLINLIESISGYKFEKVHTKKIFNQYLKVPFRKKRLINWTNKVDLKDGLKNNYDLFFP